MKNNNDCSDRLETVNFFLGEVIHEMKKIKTSTTKKDMVAYIAAWENTLQTIKFMIN